MDDKEKLDYVHSCIQEVRNGNIDVAMLDQALAFVEDVRESHWEEMSDDYVLLCFSCKRITPHEEQDIGAEWGIPLACTCCGSQNHVLTYGDEGEIKTMEEIDAEARDYENNRRGGE